MSESQSFNAQIERILEEAPDRLSKKEVLASIKKVLIALEKEKVHTTEDFYRELRRLSHYILKTRQEIFQMQPELIQRKHIPVATDELDAVVGATEEATGQILDAVEHIESISQGLDNTLKSDIGAAASIIYEACSFQDITGQRIAKVVTALQEIEKTVGSLMNSLGDFHSNSTGEESSPDLLAFGPQLPGQAHTQEDIDKLFNDR